MIQQQFKILKLTQQCVIIQCDFNRHFQIENDQKQIVRYVRFQTKKTTTLPKNIDTQKKFFQREVVFSSKDKIIQAQQIVEYFMYDFEKNPKLSKIQEKKLWWTYPQFWMSSLTNMQVFKNYVQGQFLTKEESQKQYYQTANINIKLPPDYYQLSPQQIVKFLEQYYGFGEEKYFHEQYQDSIKIIDLGKIL